MIMKTKYIALLSLALGVLPAAAHAAENKVSSGMGHDLAQALCSNCHMIEPGQTNPPGHVGGPAFQDVANRPGVDREMLRTHLATTHTNAVIPLSMPNPNLTHDEMGKILDYLVSLKTKSRP